MSKITENLTPLQKSIYSILCDSLYVTRKALQRKLRDKGFFEGRSFSSADREIRDEKVNMIYLGIPIGSAHGVADIGKNADKKVEKGYCLIIGLNSPEAERSLAEYQTKIETLSKTKNALSVAIVNFPNPRVKANPAPINQPSLFQEVPPCQN
jgi:predicted phosphoribosyltransferase